MARPDPAASALRLPTAARSRAWVVVGLGVAAALSARLLELRIDDLAPSDGGLALARDFLSRALSPALTSEAAFVPAGTPPLLVLAAQAAGETVRFAAAAMGLAVTAGIALGFLASSAWWERDESAPPGPLGRVAPPLVYAGARLLIAGLRSIHELLWAVLLLAAFGLTPMAAVLAIALPYAGTLAKVYSELVDEAPRDAARALRDAGARDVHVYLFALVPRALPDMAAYTFYRFECALRSSAVLGFFGFPTLGLYIRQSFASSNHGEVWTFLYVLIALVAGFEAWSGAIRRRLVG